MGRWFCSVFGCNSTKKRNPEISFHAFPQKGQEKVYVINKLNIRELVDRHGAWVKNLKLGKPVTKYMKVCSRHFKKDDYFYRTGGSTARQFLKKTAVPTLHLPSVRHGETEATSSGNSRNKRAEKRAQVQASTHSPLQSSLPQNSPKSLVHEEIEEIAYVQNEIDAAEGLLGLLSAQPLYVGPKQFRDFQVQVNTPKCVNICSLINTDTALNSFTGLSSFKMLDTIEKAVKSFYCDERLHKLNIRERIILTLVKLKCDLSYSVMSVLFGISIQLCIDYICKMFDILSAALEPEIEFIEMDEIKRNVPECFESFRNVRVVLDCTEVIIQKPKCLCCRIRFYSQYKSNTTIKIMTGVSPAGVITLLSKVYGGRSSDKAIFEQSDAIIKLNRGEAIIMVDKGFLIDDLCNIFHIKLIRPPFLGHKKQLSAEDAILNAKISKARVHVERVNQRLKILRFFQAQYRFLR